MNDIKLGDKILDMVSGLEGIATQRIEYLDGTASFAIQPTANKSEGTRPALVYVDEHCAKKLGGGVHMPTVKPTPGFQA